MNEGVPGGEGKDFKAADEPPKFEVKQPPEIKDGYTEDNKVEVKRGSDTGYTRIHEIKNEKGETVFKRESWYDAPNGEVDPDPENETNKSASDRQIFFTIDDTGRCTEKFGQTLSTEPGDPKHENQWSDKIEYTDSGRVITGAIETGPDVGHKYTKTFETRKLDGERKIIEKTEINEQGENGSGKKPKTGDIFEKIIYMEGSTWRGEKVIHPDGHVTTQLPDNAESLPNWE